MAELLLYGASPQLLPSLLSSFALFAPPKCRNFRIKREIECDRGKYSVTGVNKLEQSIDSTEQK